MAKPRRVALAIELTYALRHHHGIFAGTQIYARERANWICEVQPFIGSLRRGAGANKYDGIIARATQELVKNAAQARVPLVNIWSAATASSVPSVLPDFTACGRMAAEHLLHRGFRQFAFHGFTRHQASVLTWNGFYSELRKAKYTPERLNVSSNCDENARSWNKFTRDLEHSIVHWKPPIGVLVSQDILGRYTANACLNAGLRIPEDVALIGLGNEPIICQHPEPSLSSFDLNYEKVGYEAAVLLNHLMDGKPAPVAPILIEPGKLSVRRSTDAYVVDDPLIVAALRYIGENCHAEVRAETVANYVHTSIRTLERRFRAALGRTMSAEITRLRIERAKRLLLESDILVKNVARQCGFKEVKHFHKMFQAAEGMTPGEFRARS